MGTDAKSERSIRLVHPPDDRGVAAFAITQHGKTSHYTVKEILCEIGARLGHVDKFLYQNVEEIFEDFVVSTRGAPADYSGLTYAKIGTKGVFWPCPHPNHPAYTGRASYPQSSRGWHQYPSAQSTDDDHDTRPWIPTRWISEQH